MTMEMRKPVGAATESLLENFVTPWLARLFGYAKLVEYSLILQADVILNRLRPQTPAALRRITGAVQPGSRKYLCVFAHFDRDGLVEDYVVYYLSKLEKLGCEIVFVSTAESMETEQIEKLRPHCAQTTYSNLVRPLTSSKFAL